MTVIPFALLEHRDMYLICSVMPSPYQCTIITELMNASCPGQSMGPRFNASRSLWPPTLVPHFVIDLLEPQFLHL